MVMYSPLALAVKVSILFILVRIFAPYRKVVVFIYVFLSVLLAYTIAATIAKICICMPIGSFWLGTDVTHGHCLKELEIFLTDGVVSMVSDLAILILPLTVIWRLQLSMKKKLRVMAILAAGGMVCVATIVRLIWIIQYRDSIDQTYALKRIDLCGSAEIAIGIICACLPALATFTRHIRDKPSRSEHELISSVK